MKIGIIGCGLIGKKRALALEEFEDDTLVACCDTDKNKIGEKFSKEFKCDFYNNYKTLIDDSDCDIIIVAVINKYAKDIVLYALKNNKHVLIEKPMGINYEESLAIIGQKIINGTKLKVGFNHRFHPAITKAKELFDNGTIGELMFIKGQYGHGGRPGMENEWRTSKELCGGGQLLDQGVHLIDLSLWFSDDIKSVFSTLSTQYWKNDVEDNAFLQLKSKRGVDIQLHASWNYWKNVFVFEIYGKDGYLKINGLGGSYGEETLEIGKRNVNGGVPYIKTLKFDKEDISWEKEWINFKSSIIHEYQPIGNEIDGAKANRIIDAAYESSTKNKIINL